jgi:copper transport protein
MLQILRPVRPLVLALIAVALVSTLVIAPAPVSGHAYLDRSNPDAGDIIEDVPEEVRLWFTEPLEPDHSFIILYDATGTEIDGVESRIDPGDQFQMYMPLPDDLPNGTYTVQWRNISAADGHSQSGFFAFTIGSREDMTEPVAPSEDATTGDPGLLEPVSKWLSFVGITTAVGTVVAWLWVIRPALLERSQALLVTARRRARWLSVIGLGIAVIGSLLALLSQTIVVTLGLSVTDIADTLFSTQYGLFWGLRMVQFAMLGAILYSAALWRQTRVRRTGWLALGIAVLALLPFSMSSHAAAVSIGTNVAIINDWLHLAATSVWVGGLIAMMAAVILPLRKEDPVERQQIYADVIPRFSTLAIISVVILTLSGVYSAWLQVGSVEAMRETEYGQTLGLKLLLSVPLYLLGAINLMVIGPWMKRAARAGKHFGRTVAAEIAIASAVLGVVAVLISMAPARDTLESQAERTNFRFEHLDLTAAVYISPGAVGQNNYTVDVIPDDGVLPEETSVELRVGREALLGGVRSIDLDRVPEGDRGRSVRFESTGSDLSVPGTWDMEILIRRPGEVDWRINRSLEVPEIPAQDQIPGPPPRLEGFQAIGAPIGFALAIIFGVVAARNRFRSEPDRILGWLALMFLVFAALTTWQTMVETTPTTQARNPILMTPQSVATGQEIYMEYCAVCHGPGGEGDGEGAAELSRPPADLTGPHVEIHTDGDIYWWIMDGIDPAMPGFEDQLSDEEAWHLVNYIRSLRNPIDD